MKFHSLHQNSQTREEKNILKLFIFISFLSLLPNENLEISKTFFSCNFYWTSRVCSAAIHATAKLGNNLKSHFSCNKFHLPSTIADVCWDHRQSHGVPRGTMVPLVLKFFINLLLHLVINLKITQKYIHQPPRENFLTPPLLG